MTDTFDPQVCDNYRKRFGEKRGLALIESAQNSLRKQTTDLQEGFASQNQEQMTRAVHSLKSSAANLGSNQLRISAESLEHRYMQGTDLADIEAVEALAALVKATLLKVQSYLSA